jgi:hypothetical protein
MARTKKPSSRKRRKTVLPALGAGMSLAMVGGASATTTAPTTDVSSQKTNPVITLHEEELSDVSLGTFYVFDRENDPTLGQGMQLAARGCGGGGARGCGGGGARGCGCGGARGCGCGGARGCRGCGGARGCGCGGRGCGCGGFRACGVGCAVACSCGGCSGPCWLWTPAGWVYTC